MKPLEKGLHGRVSAWCLTLVTMSFTAYLTAFCTSCGTLHLILSGFQGVPAGKALNPAAAGPVMAWRGGGRTVAGSLASSGRSRGHEMEANPDLGTPIVGSTGY